jgi:hypothetical protein
MDEKEKRSASARNLALAYLDARNREVPEVFPPVSVKNTRRGNGVIEFSDLPKPAWSMQDTGGELL